MDTPTPPTPPVTPKPDLQMQATEKMVALESWLAPIFAKFPHLPQSVIDVLVQIAPFLALIGGIFLVFGAVMTGFFASLLSFAFLSAGVSPLILFVAVLLMLVAGIIDLLAFKPLSDRKKSGWNLIFYGSVLSAVSTIANLIFGAADLGSIIGIIVTFWLLFEVRGQYKA